MSPEELEREVHRLRDYQEIEQLQHRYCHYIGLKMGGSIIELFARTTPGIEVEVAESGVFEGPEAPHKYFGTYMGTATEPTAHPTGEFVIHMAVNPVIEINAAGTRAKALWISPGLHTVRTDSDELLCEWQYGRYVTEMVKEEGQWRFLKFRWFRTFNSPYYQSWADAWHRNFLGRPPKLPEPDRPTSYHRPYRPDEPVINEPAPPLPFND